jgi:hypothetical protein
MKEFVWWFVWVAVHLMRVVLVIWFVSSLTLLGVVLAAIEGMSVTLSVSNVFAAKRRDLRWSGFLLPLMYVAGFVVLPPAGQGSLWLFFPLWLVALCLVVWGYSALGRCYTAASATWVGLCNGGPYRYVRHPQALARCLVVVSVLLTDVDGFPALRCVVAFLLVVVATVVEEGFLFSSGEYVAYSIAVPYRLFPGVW